jgi:ADP-ribosylglycohydrolase
MIGAIAGDIIGSIYEYRSMKTKEFPLFGADCSFTDDSIMTVAVADAILHGGAYFQRMRYFVQMFPDADYGGMFRQWAQSSDPKPYGSFGNGSAMRVSPVGFAFNDLPAVLEEAKRSAEVTHNHPEGIKGAQSVAAAIYLARNSKSKDEIRSYIERTFGYDLRRSLDAIRPGYRFDETCQRTVPEALISFFESSDFEDAVRNAISLGGDADTLACIAGGVAEAFYGGVPEDIEQEVLRRLDPALKSVVERFRAAFVTGSQGGPR